MFNIGGGELLVIMLIALIVLGPSRLPDAARQVGKTMGDLRRLSQGFQNEMKGALDTVDDPTRVSARRNVLAKDAPEAAETGPTTTAVEAVSSQPSAPVKKDPPAAQGKPTTRKAPVKAAPLKASPAKKATAKKAAPAVSKAAPRRSKA